MNIEEIIACIKEDKTLTKEQFLFVKKAPIHQHIMVLEAACRRENLDLAKDIHRGCSITAANIQDITVKMMTSAHHQKTHTLDWLFSFKPDISLDIQHRCLIDNNDNVLNSIFMHCPINKKFVYHLINYALQKKCENSLNWMIKHQQQKMIPYHADMYYYALHSMFEAKVYTTPEELSPLPELFINIFDLLDEDYRPMMDERLIGRRNPLHDHPKIMLSHEAPFVAHIDGLFARYLHQRIMKVTQPKHDAHKVVKKRLKV